MGEMSDTETEEMGRAMLPVPGAYLISPHTIDMWVCPICGDRGEDKPEMDCIGPTTAPHEPAAHQRVTYIKQS